MGKATTAQGTNERISKLTVAQEVTTSGVSADPLVSAPLSTWGDAAAFNDTFNWEPTSGLPTHILDLAATDVRGKPVLAHGPNVNPTTLGYNSISWQLDAGVQQDTSDGKITYTFATWNHGVGLSNSPQFYQGQGYTEFTDAQKAAAHIAIANWDDLIAAEMVYVPEGRGASVFGKNSADIVLANTYTGPAQAEAYYPGLVQYYGKKYQRVEGDVWTMDPRFNSSNLQLDPGQYGLQTLNHELGHALGLSHPGTYNFGDDQDGDGEPDDINYAGDAQYFQDSNQFTIMSYFDAYETGAQPIDWNVMRYMYASTPMVDDVFVIQQKYGADMSTRDGATTYGFNATSDVTNEALRFETGEMATIFTIWDGGGIDTLDLSGYYTPSIIDLREGAYSSAGGFGAYDAAAAAARSNVDSMSRAEFLSYINPANSAAGLGARDGAYDLYFGGRAGANDGVPWNEITNSVGSYLIEQNIGIAYGAVIENAIGGHGADRINGNAANNMFTGGAGADTFVLADYTGFTVPLVTGGHSTVLDDDSIDTITDFDSGFDRIDLSELNVTADQLTSQTSVVGGITTTTVTIDRSGSLDDFIFVVQGEVPVVSDYYFG